MDGETLHDVRWHRLELPGDRLGVSCDADGPSIGPVRLLRRTADGFVPRPTLELDFILSLALGYRASFAEKSSGLGLIAHALDCNDLPYAMFATQLMRLPTLADERAFNRAVRADALAKGFDPDQLRDEQGRWTSDGSGSSAANGSGGSPNAPGGLPLVPAQFFEPVVPFLPPLEEILPVEPLPPIPGSPGDIVPPQVGSPDIAVPRSGDAPFPSKEECEQEWANAHEKCKDVEGKLGTDGFRGYGRDYERCVQGMVSQDCGGGSRSNDPGTWRKPKNGRGYRGPRGGSAYDLFI